MAQKSYREIKLELMLNLLKKKENHVRGIAKDIKIPHTTVLRKINELLDENVLDSRRQGKNKIFFLKKNYR